MAFDVLSFVMGQKAAGGSSDIELIENLSITADFSEGNQFVEAPEGQAVKSAVIQKPANLLPQNIAEGIDIAGIIGTLASSGGTLVVSAGSFVLKTGTSMTITHNLGVVPFMVFYAQATAWDNTSGTAPMALGFNEKMSKTINKPYGALYHCAYNSIYSKWYIPDRERFIEETNTRYAIQNATETTVVLGGSDDKLQSESQYGKSYEWVAFGIKE